MKYLLGLIDNLVKSTVPEIQADMMKLKNPNHIQGKGYGRLPEAY